MRNFYIRFFCFVIIGFWLLIIGCSGSFRSNKSIEESYSNKVKEIGMLSFKMIKTGGNVIIGYLEETENIVSVGNAGGGNTIRRIYYVYNKDFSRVGFITEHGTVSVYQYTAAGTAVQVAKDVIYTIDAGTRILLSYNGPIYYDDFEPAPLWREEND